MDPSPAVYVRPKSSDQLSLHARLIALVVSLACLGVLVIAAKLQPSPNGLGSHRQLGLQECQFESRTGLPCPTCGMTTSFAHFVRGQILASLWVQPMGTLLALITTMAFWAALYIAVSARPAHRLLNLIPARYYFIPLLALLVIAWAWKIWIHVTGRDGWN